MDRESYFLDLLEGDQDDPNVQYEIGRCYLQGIGVEPDGAQAEFWLRKAAAQDQQDAMALLTPQAGKETPAETIHEGNLMDWCVAAEGGDPEAQYRLALYFGRGKDAAAQGDVARYLNMAAAQGHPEACVTLGEQLLEGDPAQAVRHLKNAADCGVPKAMELLGRCYCEGMGVPKNGDEALVWFEAAAQRGTPEDKLRLALRFQLADGVPYSMGRAMAWVHRAQLAGMEDAQEQFWEKAEKFEKKEQKRLEGGRKIKMSGLGPALLREEVVLEGRLKPEKYGISSCLVDNQPVTGYMKKFHAPNLSPSDRTKADNWNRKFRQDIESLVKDDAQWTKLGQKAASGNAQAQWMFGMVYHLGAKTPSQTIKQNDHKAYRWFVESARQDDANGQYWLAWAHAYGWGAAKKNLDLAEYWWMKAASQGHEEALKVLNQCIYNTMGRVADIQEWPFGR